MNPEAFAEWLRRQGHRVVRTKSSYWYDPAPGVFQAFPYSWLITPSGSEIRSLMLRHGVAAVRYSAPFDFHRGVVSYHIILREPYSLEGLKSQARNGVRAGMGHFTIEPIPFERLAYEGWVLQEDTLARQGRLRCMNHKTWERICLSACGLPGFEAWGALSGTELAAAVIVARIGPEFTVPYALSHRRFLGDHVNNALFYCASRELLQRPGVERLFFTVQSLDAPAHVDEFKFRMGLKPRLVRQCVEIHPLLRPFATNLAHRCTRALLEWDSSNPFLTKAEGMLRFHLEGRKPACEQSWPEPLREERKQFARSPAKLGEAGPVQAFLATPYDIPTLVRLHETCLSEAKSPSMLFGPRFILAVYRWLLGLPNARVIVARKGEDVVGFTAYLDRPYLGPMVRACWRPLARGILARPWRLLDRRMIELLLQMFTAPRREAGPRDVGHILYTAVDPRLQHQGIGMLLKAATIRSARELGLTGLSTGVSRQNVPALRLNQKAGFATVESGNLRSMILLHLDLQGGPDSLPREPAPEPSLGKKAAAVILPAAAGPGSARVLAPAPPTSTPGLEHQP